MSKIVIFDLDGTVLDTIEDITDAMNNALTEFGYEKVCLEEMKECVGGNCFEMAEKATKGKADEKTIVKIANSYVDYIKNFSSKTKIFSGMDKVINVLKDEGCKVCALSNKAQEEIDVLLNKQLSELHLDCAIGVSKEVKEKPSPSGVYNIMKKYNVPISNCWLVGDGETDVLTSINAGINNIAVLWGNREKETLKKYGAKNFASTPLDILRYVM